MNRILEFETALLNMISSKYAEIEKSIREKKEITPETEELLVKAIKQCKEEFLNS